MLLNWFTIVTIVLMNFFCWSERWYAYTRESTWFANYVEAAGYRSNRCELLFDSGISGSLNRYILGTTFRIVLASFSNRYILGSWILGCATSPWLCYVPRSEDREWQYLPKISRIPGILILSINPSFSVFSDFNPKSCFCNKYAMLESTS